MVEYSETLINRLDAIEKQQVETIFLLRQISTQSALPPAEEEMPQSVQQAARFLNVSPQTVYQNIAKIPHKKRHGRLYFFRSELVTYLNEGAASK